MEREYIKHINYWNLSHTLSPKPINVNIIVITFRTIVWHLNQAKKYFTYMYILRHFFLLWHLFQYFIHHKTDICTSACMLHGVYTRTCTCICGWTITNRVYYLFETTFRHRGGYSAINTRTSTLFLFYHGKNVCLYI